MTLVLLLPPPPGRLPDSFPFGFMHYWPFSLARDAWEDLLDWIDKEYLAPGNVRHMLRHFPFMPIMGRPWPRLSARFLPRRLRYDKRIFHIDYQVAYFFEWLAVLEVREWHTNALEESIRTELAHEFMISALDSLY